jgi:hypothetical protein
MLVNLMAMILLGGKQSFLWTFVFEPSTLQNTFGEFSFLSIHFKFCLITALSLQTDH